MQPPPSGSTSLRDAALTGIRWTTFARVVTQVVALLGTIALARLVPPSEFGLAAIALIACRVATVVAGQSFGTPLVQRKDLRKEHVETAVLLSLVLGVALALVTGVAIPELLRGDAPRLAALLQLSGFAFLLAGAAVVPQALLQRGLEFRRLSSIDMVAHLCGGAAAIALAFAGLDGEAIVLGAVTSMAVAACAMSAAAGLSRPRWDGPAAREIASFGTPATGAAFLGTVWSNMDYVILGAKMSAAQVGFYFRAFTLAVGGQRKLTSVMSQLAFPLYARADDREHMGRMRIRIVRLHATLVLPALAAFAAAAPDLLPLLLGPGWEPAIVPAQILAVSGMVSSLVVGTGPLLLATGHVRALLGYNVFQVVLFGLVLLLVSPLGLVAVCIGVTSVYLTCLLVVVVVLYRRVLLISTADFLAEVVPGAVAASVVALVAFPVARLDDLGLAVPLTLLAVAGVSAAAAVAVIRTAFSDVWSDLTMMTAAAFRPKPARTSPGAGARPAIASEAQA